MLGPPRICPGKRFAIQTVYLVVACVLSTFNVGPALGEDGSPEVLKAEFDSLFNRYVTFLGTSINCAAMLTRRCATFYQESQTFQMYNRAPI